MHLGVAPDIRKGVWNMATIWRLPQVLAESGKKRSPLYADISQGLWPRPIKLGIRAVGWPADEVRTLNAARIAGKTDSEIRELVNKLEASRKAALPV
jgi:prophage regulatory protein